MSAHEIPESVREYLGHDKVALFGRGGRPAPPAPPDSPARRHGELAVREALEAIGRPGPQPGDRPAARPPKPSISRRMRANSEQALMEASMRKHGRVDPLGHTSFVWRRLFAPGWRVVPWGVKRRLLAVASGVRGWRR